MEPTAAGWPLVVYLVLALVLVAGMLGLSALLGQRRSRPSARPYESGLDPVVSTRVRSWAKYYLLAMFFVIFDLEVVFIVAWAIAARQLGCSGYAGVGVFSLLLLLALGYLWRQGALDWGTSALKRREP